MQKPKPDPVIEWIRPPRQARSQETLDRLLEAAEDLISKRGFHGTTVVQIASAAGCSVGSFYERFQDKNALLLAMHEQYCAELGASAEVGLAPERWQAVPVSQIVRAVLGFLVRNFRERTGLVRTFLLEGYENPTMRSRADQVLKELRERLGRLLESRREEIAHPNPGVAAAFLAHVAISTLANSLLAWRDVGAGPYPMTTVHEGFGEELFEICRAHLGFRETEDMDPGRIGGGGRES